MPVRLRRSATTIQSRSAKAIAGSGRLKNNSEATTIKVNTASASNAAGRRHNGMSRHAFGVGFGARKGVLPISPTS